jgi:hypothetical protein
LYKIRSCFDICVVEFLYAVYVDCRWYMRIQESSTCRKFSFFTRTLNKFVERRRFTGRQEMNFSQAIPPTLPPTSSLRVARHYDHTVNCVSLLRFRAVFYGFNLFGEDAVRRNARQLLNVGKRSI